VFVNADKIVATLDALDILKDKIDRFHQELDRLLIIPRLETQEGSIPVVSAEGDMLRVMGHENDLSAYRLFADLQLVIEFLDAHLPAAVMLNLSRILIPNLTNRLINTRLSSSVPPSLNELPAFEQLLEETKRFEEMLHEQQWMTDRDLSEWVDRAPKVWLAKRRESSLDSARKIVVLGVGETETVGRSETRTIDVEDGEGAFVAGVSDVAGVDDWNSGWNDDEAAHETMIMEPAKEESPRVEEPAGFIQDDEDDDGADGWGLDEDLGFDDDHAPPKEQESEVPPGEPKQEALAQKNNPHEDEEDMDWSAWGEDDDIAISPTYGAPAAASAPSTPAPLTATAVPSLSNHHKRPFTSKKDITLTETYTITSIPRQLITLIAALTTEAEALSGLAYSSSSIAPAASGLLSIPTLILATFRALAPVYYPPGLCANMYLYNDATYLTLSLPPDSVSDSDLTRLFTFARRCYSQEMETQRIVLTDYLDAAQGFNSCDNVMQARACDEAVSYTVSQLRELHKEWGQVLSKTAVGQSLGSLLNTVVVKMMNDILDLADISEAEGVRLVRYCSEVENFGIELFSGKRMVEVYCRSWRRFGFVKRILGSGLLEVVTLLKEGEVLGEMEVEEVVELVKALFADTEIRTRCLEEIRRFG
jgi:centromere/kinetochore protein ZW10